MFCRKCGSEMLDDSLFCPKCGQKVESVDNNLKETILAKEIIITPVTDNVNDKENIYDINLFEGVYNKAEQLQREKKFEEAAEIYATIPNFKDSQDRLNKCRQNIKWKEQAELEFKQDKIFKRLIYFTICIVIGTIILAILGLNYCSKNQFLLDAQNDLFRISSTYERGFNICFFSMILLGIWLLIFILVSTLKTRPIYSVSSFVGSVTVCLIGFFCGKNDETREEVEQHIKNIYAANYIDCPNVNSLMGNFISPGELYAFLFIILLIALIVAFGISLTIYLIKRKKANSQ